MIGHGAAVPSGRGLGSVSHIDELVIRMSCSTEATRPPPLPLNEPQTLVMYTGRLSGAFRVGRTPSGRDYYPSASEPLFPVLDIDLPRFERDGQFVVHHEHHHDPALPGERDRLKAWLTQATEPLKAQIAALEERAASPTEPKPRRRGGGRPPRSIRDLQLMHHLRHHVFPGLTWVEIAQECLGEAYANPASAAEAAVRRFRRESPETLAESRCPFCE